VVLQLQLVASQPSLLLVEGRRVLEEGKLPLEEKLLGEELHIKIQDMLELLVEEKVPGEELLVE